MAEGADLFGHHTEIHPAKIEPFGYFPIRLIRTADGVVVTRATHEHKDLLGAQLVGIGDTFKFRLGRELKGQLLESFILIRS